MMAVLSEKNCFECEDREVVITIEDRIAVDLADSYGIICDEIIPVTGGWLNQLWKVSAGGYFLLE